MIRAAMNKKKKKTRGKVLVVDPQPDMRTECPTCMAKAKRPLIKTVKITISGKPRRRGYYKCGVGTCKQSFCRLLSD
jgi:hypothetical protein